MTRANPQSPLDKRWAYPMTCIGFVTLTLIAVGALNDVTATSFAANTTLCKYFEQGKAFCNAPLTAGVSIESELGGRCTAGPLVLPKAPANRGETYVLTAGHCIKKGGGEGKSWFAFTQAGEKKEIGKSGKFIYGNEGDVGVIKINDPGSWALLNSNPTLYAVMAKWGTLGKSFLSVPVVGEAVPALNNRDCLEGQITDETCGGIIVNLDESITPEQGVTIEHLAESEGIFGAPGDSGGPVYLENSGALRLEGTLVGQKRAGKIVYEPLGTAFAELNAKKGLDLELLTTANEVRNKQVKSGPLTLEGGGATLECSSVEGQWKIVPPGNEVTNETKLGFTIEKWNGCGEKTKEMSGLKPTVKECMLRFGEVDEKALTTRLTLASECVVETKVLFLTCKVSLPAAKESEKVNFNLEKNALETIGSNLLIGATDSGVTTEVKGTCPGVTATKEGKLKMTLTGEGLKIA